MTIIIKNKETLIFDDFIFRCSVGKNGFTKNKIEGDFSTPRGLFDLGDLYYRKDRSKKPLTKLNIKIINQNMGWCCLLYTSPSPRDGLLSRMPSSA